MFGSHVVREQWKRHEAPRGGDVDDHAAPARDHLWEHGSGAAPNAAQVDVEHERPRLLAELVRGDAGGADEAGVVHQHVDGAEFCPPMSDGCLDLLGSSHVGDSRNHPAAAITAARGGFVEVVAGGERIGARVDGRADIGEEEVVARFGECDCGGATDAARGACDEDRPRHEPHRNAQTLWRLV